MMVVCELGLSSLPFKDDRADQRFITWRAPKIRRVSFENLDHCIVWVIVAPANDIYAGILPLGQIG